MESSGILSLCYFIQPKSPKVVPIALMSWSYYKSSSGSGAQGLSEKSPHPSLLSSQNGPKPVGLGSWVFSFPGEESSVVHLQKDLERQGRWAWSKVFP